MQGLSADTCWKTVASINRCGWLSCDKDKPIILKTHDVAIPGWRQHEGHVRLAFSGRSLGEAEANPLVSPMCFSA